MATSEPNQANCVQFSSNAEDEHLEIQMNMINETYDSAMLSWMYKNKKCLERFILIVISSIAIFLMVLGSFYMKEDSFKPFPPEAKANQTETASAITSPLLPNCPAGWKAYADLKCLHVIGHMEAYEKAVELCREADSEATLLNIQTETEQLFMEKLLFSDLAILNSVWLRAQSNRSAAGSQKRQFSNWAAGKHSPGSDGRECTQMVADHHAMGTGKWLSVRCRQKGVIVCQRLQNWSLAKLQANLLETLTQMELQQKEVEVLQKGVLPVGFIYVQLPHQLDPEELWPNFVWVDISDAYANVFFRVVGDKAADFGELQEEGSPRLTSVTITDNNSNQYGTYEVTPGKGSDGIPVKSQYDGNADDLKYMYMYVSDAEVRPQNMAIKVWKRVA